VRGKSMGARDILADWGVKEFRVIDRAAIQEMPP